VVDGHGPGGQAGTSSRIENYLGFPAGGSGSELTHRAITQARRLGAEFIAPVEGKAVKLLGGLQRPPGRRAAPGAGAYSGAPAPEAQACRGGRVMVIGGGNSAGQAAMYLAGLAKEGPRVIPKEPPAAPRSNNSYNTH